MAGGQGTLLKLQLVSKRPRRGNLWVTNMGSEKRGRASAVRAW